MTINAAPIPCRRCAFSRKLFRQAQEGHACPTFQMRKLRLFIPSQSRGGNPFYCLGRCSEVERKIIVHSGHVGGVGGGAGVCPDLLAFSSELSGCLNLVDPAKPREGTLPQGGALLDQPPPLAKEAQSLPLPDNPVAQFMGKSQAWQLRVGIQLELLFPGLS